MNFCCKENIDFFRQSPSGFGVIILSEFSSLREKCLYSELFWSAFSRVPFSLSLRIQSECGKMQTRITPNTDTFYAVPFR